MLKKTDNAVMGKYDYCGACTFYLGAIIVLLICQALAGVVSAALVKSYPDISSNGDFNTAFMICIQAFNLGYIVLFTKLHRYKFDFGIVKNNETGKGITPSVIIVPVISAVLLMIGMYLPTIWFGYFTKYAIRIPPEMGSVQLTTTSSVVMIVLASVFFAPICEETIYRGVLFNGLRRERTVLNAVLLSALAFMLMHLSIVQVVFQFSIGVVSAFIMHKTKRLAPSVILHAVANSLALIIELTPLSAVLNGCLIWLTQNIAAAFFITLGLFASAFGLLFVIIKFGFNVKDIVMRVKKDASEKEQITPQTVTDEITASARKKDGTFRFWIGIVLCAVLLVINLIVSVV